MSELELGLGQREISVGDALTDDELKLVEMSHVPLKFLHLLLGVTNSKMTLNAALGGAVILLKSLQDEKTVADPRGLGVTWPSENQ